MNRMPFDSLTLPTVGGLRADAIAPTAARPLAALDKPTQAPFSVDVRSLVGQIDQTFNPLSRDCELDYQVTRATDGYVTVSVLLPEGMTRAYMALLGALTGFVRVVDNKSRLLKAESAAQAPQLDYAAQQRRAAFDEEVSRRFDLLTAQGLSDNDCVKRINADLKQEDHPLAFHDLIRASLSSQGRFRKSKAVHGKRRDQRQ